MSEIVLFDYGQLDVETRITVRQRTEEIKTLVRRSAQDIIDIGNKLIDVKQRLGHGGFGEWLDQEFGWSDQTARRFMHVAEFAKINTSVDFGKFQAKALYLIAAPSTPEPARSELVERSNSGEDITAGKAAVTISQHRIPAPPANDNLALDKEIHRLSSWLINRGWGIMSAPMPEQCYVGKGTTKFTFSNREDREGELQALQRAKAHEEAAQRGSPVERTLDAALPAIQPAQPPVDRPRPVTPRPLTDNEVEAVIWRAIAHHAKSGMPHHKLAWLQTAEVGDFSRLLNPGVSFEAEQLTRIKAKVEAELMPATPPGRVSAGNSATPPIVEPEPAEKDGDENYTPPYIIKAAREVLGKIDLDPASCATAQRVVLATVYLTKANDSLQPQVPWLGRVWLNPPFSKPAPFTNKLIEEYEAGRTKAAILLVNNGTETQWGQALLSRPYPVCFVGAHVGGRSRIDFWQTDPDEPRTGNRYAQMIFYLGKEPDKFREVFSQFGVIR